MKNKTIKNPHTGKIETHIVNGHFIEAVNPKEDFNWSIYFNGCQRMYRTLAEAKQWAKSNVCQ